MTCYSPKTAWRSKHLNENGIYPVVFDKSKTYTDHPIQLMLPCRNCVGCRLERSRQWAIRCHHESQMHEHNCFITLTFDDEHLFDRRKCDALNENAKHDPSLSVHVEDWQRFMGRLRKRLNPRGHTHPRKIVRFFHCGEYGDKFGRPHYHACLFGYDFPDKKLWKKTADDQALYRSAQLEELWPFGFSSVGTVTFQSAAYVARYIMKKVNGDDAADHYIHTDEHGEIHTRRPEYTTMSRDKGIGRTWLEKFGATDCYAEDFIVVNGRKMKPPKFYDDILKLQDPAKHELLMSQRAKSSRLNRENTTPDRLAVREIIAERRADKLHRELK